MKNLNLIKKFSILLFVLGFSAVVVSCEDEEDTPQPKSIAVIAQGNPNLTTLVAALQRADLVNTLNSAGTYTVFAPTNAAFTAFLGAGVSVDDVPVATLRQLLLNHVIATQNNAAALPSDGYIKTLAIGSASTTNTISMYVKKTGAVVELNGSATVTTANVAASNGIIHIVDEVIAIPNVVDAALANDSFTSLVGALTGTGQPDFVGTLSGTGPFTVFAPTNAAFTALNTELAPGGIAGVSAANLTKVLQYHVVSPANVLAAQLTQGQQVTPILTPEQVFTIQLTGGAKILDASGRTSNIVITDVQCSNGVVHAIDKVLLPVL